MKVETIFILNSRGKKVPVGTMKIREVKIGEYRICNGGGAICDYYVENIMLNFEEGDKLGS